MKKEDSGLRARMQDAYFEILPPKDDEFEEAIKRGIRNKVVRADEA